jgi:hypothetical protein
MKKENRAFEHPQFGTIILTDHVIKRAMQRFEFGKDSYNFTVHFLKKAFETAHRISSFDSSEGKKGHLQMGTLYLSFGDRWVTPVVRNPSGCIVKTIFHADKVIKSI